MQERSDGGIRCSGVLEALSAYVDGELPAEKRESIEKHLLTCPNCRQFGENFAKMVNNLKADQLGGCVLDEGRVAQILASVDAAQRR